MGVINGCDQWVWSMAVSVGDGFTGKPHHEVSLFLLSCVVFAASFLLPSFFVRKIFRSLIVVLYSRPVEIVYIKRLKMIVN